MNRALLFAAFTTFALVSLSACGGTTEPTPGPASAPQASEEPEQVPANYIALLLFSAEVSEVAGVGPLTTEYRDQKAAAAAIDPAQVEHIDSFDSLWFDIDDGARSLVLTTMDLDSEGAATDRLGLMSSGMSDLPDKIGDASVYVEVNEAGIGSMVVFKKGEWVVSLHTAQRDGVSPIVDLEKLTTLARTVADRL